MQVSPASNSAAFQVQPLADPLAPYDQHYEPVVVQNHHIFTWYDTKKTPLLLSFNYLTLPPYESNQIFEFEII